MNWHALGVCWYVIGTVIFLLGLLMWLSDSVPILQHTTWPRRFVLFGIGMAIIGGSLAALTS